LDGGVAAIEGGIRGAWLGVIFVVRWIQGARQSVYFAVRLPEDAWQRPLCRALTYGKLFLDNIIKFIKIIK
jgi:hypothetical protein